MIKNYVCCGISTVKCISGDGRKIRWGEMEGKDGKMGLESNGCLTVIMFLFRVHLLWVMEG